jgi:high-affinity iron transporter
MKGKIMFRFTIISLVLGILLSFSLFSQETKTWNDVIDSMEELLLDAVDVYQSGDADGAKEKINEAYLGIYEKEGVERTVQAHISGKRASETEFLISQIKMKMIDRASFGEVSGDIDSLISMLREDADRLDGKKESPGKTFLVSLTIILREGLEAILIIAAIIAFLMKSGNKDKVKAVYWGIAFAILASIVMALLFQFILELGGMERELVEGFTMLFAVAVLLYVCNWMASKTHAAKWSNYIKSKVEGSLSRGSVFSLSFAAFLAVFREGAETILFYGALFFETDVYFNMIWIGLGAGSVILVGIHLLIQLLSIRLPLKAFFVGTSILLFTMAFVFIGVAVKEFQEADAIGMTPIRGMFSIDFLGIYPTVETFLPQIIVLTAAVVATLINRKMNKQDNLK